MQTGKERDTPHVTKTRQDHCNANKNPNVIPIYLQPSTSGLNKVMSKKSERLAKRAEVNQQQSIGNATESKMSLRQSCAKPNVAEQSTRNKRSSLLSPAASGQSKVARLSGSNSLAQQSPKREIDNQAILAGKTIEGNSNQNHQPKKALLVPTNPNCSYKTLADIKWLSLKGDLITRKVNLFCVVHQVLKTLSTTPVGKFTIVIEAVDQTLTENGEILKIHFFAKEDTILKEIRQGDVLRLHNVKMELYCDDTDGRVFHSSDVTLFKLMSRSIISLARNSVVTESEERKVNELKRWFEREHSHSLVSDVALLTDLRDEGTFKLFCKIVGDPYQSGGCLRLKVTDGTTTQRLSPALPLVEGASQPLVTEITIKDLQKAYRAIKNNHYIVFNAVDLEKTDSLRLTITKDVEKKFIVINKDNVGALEIERRIEESTKSSVMSDHSEKKCRPDHKRIVTVNNSKNKTSSVKHQSDDDEEQSKTESIVSSSAGKARRTLFTANSGDWSDVTEELSENSPPTLSESTDTSQLFHRLSTQPSATQDPALVKKLSGAVSSDSDSEIHNIDPAILAALVRNSDTPSPDKTLTPSTTSKPKTGSNVEKDSPTALVPSSKDDTSQSPEKGSTKGNTENKNSDDDTDEMDLVSLKSLLDVEEDFSSFLHIPIISLNVFIDRISPNPEENPFNLVSGLCKEGCQKAYLFSVISWVQKADFSIWPACPACGIFDRQHNLTLMFAFTMEVFDVEGTMTTLIVTMEHAEHFLGCSARDFLHDKTMRERCVNALKALTGGNPMTRKKRPRLQVSVTNVKETICLVETKLDFTQLL